MSSGLASIPRLARLARRTRQALLTVWHALRTTATAEHGAARARASGEQLDQGIHLLALAVQRTPADHAERPSRLSNLGAALMTRYERAGSRADLDAAVEAHSEAVTRSRPDERQRVTMLSNASMALHTQYDVTGSGEAFARADSLIALAYRCCPADHPDRPAILVNRSAVLLDRFLVLGDRDALPESVRLLREANALTLSGIDAATVRTNLGSALHTMYAAGGDGAVLDEAISAYESAVELAQAHNGDLSRCQSHLGSGLRARYSLLGQRSELDRAIKAHRRAVELTLASDPSRAQRLSSLATALATRHEREGDENSLDEAIALLGTAVEQTPDGHGDRPAHLRNLGVALTTRGEARGGLPDIDRAIDCLAQAHRATQPNAETWSGITSSLAHAYGDRHDVTGDALDLDAAIALHRKAADQLPGDRADTARICTDAGDALLARHDLLSAGDDLRHANDYFRAAKATDASPPRDRARAGFRLGHTAQLLGRKEDSATAYQSAVDLFDIVVPSWLSVSDAQHLLRELNGAASEAAAAYIDLGDLDSAVDVLEQGRALLLRYALQRSADLTHVRRESPALAERYAAAVGILSRPVGEHDDTLAPRPAANYRAAHRELDEVIGLIRRLPGLTGFGLRRRVDDIAFDDLPGTVVVINVADQRCDALIVDSDGIVQLPLPGLDPDEAAAQARRFTTAVTDRNDYAARAVLAWVWDVVAEPVLGCLGHTEAVSGEPTDRIIWSATGALAVLPIHAAGRHRLVGEKGVPLAEHTVVDRVVSSYTPTLHALAAAAQLNRPPARPRILVVAMPTTPGYPDLPRAADDAAVISDLAGGRCLVLGGVDDAPAAYAAVTSALNEYRWVHLSAHAVSDSADPSRSRILLQDHRSRPLTVAGLGRLDLPGGELAFLAACTTGGVHQDLADEPINLATAFRGLGFRHVVAALWPIGDEAAAHAVSAIYRALLTGEDHSVWSTTAMALAVHRATLTLRAAAPGRPSSWAAYVHHGP